MPKTLIKNGTVDTAERSFMADILIDGEKIRSAVTTVPFLIRVDRKSTRLNSSHRCISYAVFCLKKKKLLENHPLQHSTLLRRRLEHAQHVNEVDRPPCGRLEGRAIEDVSHRMSGAVVVHVLPGE